MANQRLLKLAVRLHVWPRTRLVRVIVEAIMHESCDRCGPHTRAVFRAAKNELVLTLCGHHTDRLRPHLCSAGWTVLPLRTPQPVRVLDRAGV